ncbi:MAG: hypothetical protein J7502_09565 [Flavisolibacter sp.]|nr:hypothetical protein [Flavisolibacter sp.]
MQQLSTHTEKELLLLVADSNESAFRQLYDLYDRLLMPCLTDLTKSDHVAEDLVQETMLRV